MLTSRTRKRGRKAGTGSRRATCRTGSIAWPRCSTRWRRSTDGAPPQLLDLAGGTGTHLAAHAGPLPGRGGDRPRPGSGAARPGQGAPCGTGPRYVERRPRHSGVDGEAAARRLRRGAHRDRACTGCRPSRVEALYAEIRDVLRPGGIFVNADHMPDDNLPELDQAPDGQGGRTAATPATHTGAVLSWRDWWTRVAADDQLCGRSSRNASGSTPSEHHSAEWTATGRPGTSTRCARAGYRRGRPPVAWRRRTPPSSGCGDQGGHGESVLDEEPAAQIHERSGHKQPGGERSGIRVEGDRRVEEVEPLPVRGDQTL